MSLLCRLWLLLVLAGAASSAATAQPPGEEIERARARVYPALVNIKTVSRFFAEGRARRTLTGGSGVIVDRQGHVLTNYHVAGQATRITCTLASGETLEADVLTHDPLTDLSVLRLRVPRSRAARLPYATLGDSDRLRVGETVFAMGNPLMLASSVTRGIVSNPRRVFTDPAGAAMEEMTLDSGERTGLLTRWIQHDARILPGNSGGPLVNTRGEVVGINELGGAGMGFAIPSSIARQVLREALRHGRIRRGYFGLAVLPVTRLGRTTGALISSISPSSPAEKAGLRAGDIITQLGARPVAVRFFEQVPDFHRQMAAAAPGSHVQVRYLRAGRPRTATVTVALMKESAGKEAEAPDLGVTVQQITEPMHLVGGLATARGVLVTGVREGFPSEAARPQVQPGDIVTAVNGTATPNLAAFMRAVAAGRGRDMSLAIRREDEALVTVAKPQEDAPSEYSEIAKPWLGIRTQVVTQDVAGVIGLEDAGGFRITQVYEGTEAQRAGLRAGDVIRSLNDEALESSREQDAADLRHTIEALGIGERVRIGLLRGQAVRTVEVTLEATPTSGEGARRSRNREFEFTVRELTRLDRLNNRLRRSQRGLLVVDVVSGGLAQMGGLGVGDLVASVNDTPVTSVAAFERALAGVRGRHPAVVWLFVYRGTGSHFVFIEPEPSHSGSPRPGPTVPAAKRGAERR
ncbi:MAG TPA: PDZ domain-containing protein [Chthonomonadales bacterium]|nr:PDZ domain-containing protein [Chthonomonadales bacterium]